MSPSIKNIALALALASTAAAQEQVGCFSDKGSLTEKDAFAFESQGHCFNVCKGSSVAALTKGNVCACGDEVPSGDTLPNSDCNTPCAGYPLVNCGGKNAWLVFTLDDSFDDQDDGTTTGDGDDDPTGEDEVNDSDDQSDDTGDLTPDTSDDSDDPTGEDTPNDSDDTSDNDNNDDSDDTNTTAQPATTPSGTSAETSSSPASTESGSESSPTETGSASHIAGAGSFASLLALVAFSVNM